MKSLRHRLPPLTSLMFFEAAARTLNFTRAAEELHVSQAAVSKQIRQLEEGLGFVLFERVGRRVQLSPRGTQLHSKVSAAFNYLADAVDEISVKRSATMVTLAANTAISHFWLSEVMKDFRDRNPSFPGRGYFLMRNDQRPFSPEVEQLYSWIAGYRVKQDIREAPVASR
jgi:LysR family glycine cleavage system transcriptional activator